MSHIYPIGQHFSSHQFFFFLHFIAATRNRSIYSNRMHLLYMELRCPLGRVSEENVSHSHMCWLLTSQFVWTFILCHVADSFMSFIASNFVYKININATIVTARKYILWCDGIFIRIRCDESAYTVPLWLCSLVHWNNWKFIQFSHICISLTYGKLIFHSTWSSGRMEEWQHMLRCFKYTPISRLSVEQLTIKIKENSHSSHTKYMSTLRTPTSRRVKSQCLKEATKKKIIIKETQSEIHAGSSQQPAAVAIENTCSISTTIYALNMYDS